MPLPLRLAILGEDLEFRALAETMFRNGGHERRAFARAEQLKACDWAWADVVVLDPAAGDWRERFWLLRRANSSAPPPTVLLLGAGLHTPATICSREEAGS